MTAAKRVTVTTPTSRIETARERRACFACFEPSRVYRYYVRADGATAATAAEADHLVARCQVCGNRTHWRARLVLS